MVDTSQVGRSRIFERYIFPDTKQINLRFAIFHGIIGCTPMGNHGKSLYIIYPI